VTPARSRVPALGPRDQNRGHRPRAVKYSAMLSLVFAIVGVVLWIEGGPHPRTRAAWLLLMAILIVSALPMLLCWLFCYTAAAPLPGIPDRSR
jgi:hypothetical protein